VNECWQIERQLNIIYDEMLRAASDPLYWTIPSQKHIPVDSIISLNLYSIYCFAYLYYASTLILLWVTQTMVGSGLCNLYRLANDLWTLGATMTGHHANYALKPLPPLGYCDSWLL
jgi:hypothetical protein